MTEQPAIMRHRLEITICLFLIFVTLTVYWQVKKHNFVNFDDNRYVTANPHVKEGITLKAARWAVTSTHAWNWHPLTWVSHMLDCEFYGVDAGKHHLTSLLIHIANSLLLFWIFKGMTNALWRSAFVAGIFALHPLHVESVAWISERKDVLSTFFWMLTLWAYLRYVQRPRFSRYAWVVLSLSLGLMAKPMLVTLPFVLLLLDHWPLRRLALLSYEGNVNMESPEVSHALRQKSSILGLLVEKLPLLTLSAASSIVT